MASVNRPTNVAQRDADINKKLQLYGIYSAFAKGKAPSNQQIDVALNSFLASPALKPNANLSADGRQVQADTRAVVEQAKALLLSKNDGNLLQDFLWQCQNIDGGSASRPSLPVDKDTAKQHGNEALEGLKTLGTLLISNGQFRKLLSDATVLLRDMAGDGAQSAATKLNPSEDKLNQIDEPAEDNTWHDVPDLSKDKIKSQINQVKQRTGIAKDKLKDEAADVQNDAQAAANAQPGTTTDSANAGATAAASNIKGKLTQNISEEDKQLAREKRDKAKQKTKDYLDKKMPKERREQTIYRLKKMIVEIQGHSDYQQAIDTLLRLAETYTGHTKDLGAQSKGTVQEYTAAYKPALTDMKLLLERFANGSSTDDLFDSVNQIYRDADSDPELKGYFKDLDVFIRKCLKEQGYVLKEESTQRYNELYDKGNYLLREKYKAHTDKILDEVKYLGDQFDKDPQNRAFAESLNKLFRDIGYDEQGNAAFKSDLLKDLSNVVLPGIFENVRYVPIPRVEFASPQLDAIVENLVIEGDNLAPNVMEFGSDNHWTWGRKKIPNKNKNKVLLAVSGIQMDLKDVSYFVHKKQGFPSLTDQGVMDIFLGGTGFSFKAALETADPSDKHHFFKINSVVVDVKNLKINIKQSRHKFLFSLFKGLAVKLMNPVVAKVLEKVIRDKITELDSFLYSVQQEVNRTKADLKRNPDPENAKNIYQQYATAFQKKLAEGKKKTEDVVSKNQVNMAMTQHDSIFKSIKLPGGISTKATEYKDLAAKGDKWESPVFGIGSAKPSSSLPAAPTVTRRSGQAASTSVAGGVPAATNGLTNGAPHVNGFSNQVNNAFDSPKQNLSTTLGASNPVVSGQS